MMSRHYRKHGRRRGGTGSQFKFSELPNVAIERSSFDRSHGAKTTFEGGMLIPCFLDEVLPGDTFNLRMSAFIRMATPIFPLMDNVYFDTHFFFVPNRLVWDNWERFNGAQDNPTDSTDFLIPQITKYHATIHSLSDYFGLPTGVDDLTHSSLPFRAHALIFNDWYRDENLQDSYVIPKGDGPDLITDFELERRNKRHDYFTSCLPWPQKGVSTPLPGLGTQSVHTETALTRLAGYPIRVDDPNEATFKANYLTFQKGDSGHPQHNVGSFVGSFEDHDIPVNYLENYVGGLRAHSTSTVDPQVTATINQLREAFQLQKLLERDARGGTRYIEIIKSHFGVTSDDARLQRSEYLGGGTSKLNISSVPQTSATEQGVTPQGNMGAFATGEFSGHGFTKSFTEHGHVLGYISVRADLTYQQGINKMWLRSTRNEFYLPVLAHLGEQAVLGKEIYFNNDLGDNQVFGYQSRWAEYRYKPSQISGLFRSNSGQTLDAWHLSQHFASRPTLSLGFIQEKPPFDRVVATPSQPHFIADFYFKYICSRPMPVNSNPGYIDHF